MNPYLPVTGYPHSGYPDRLFDYPPSQHAQVPLPALGSFPSERPLAPHQIPHIQQPLLSSGLNSLPFPPSFQLEPGSLSGPSSSARETTPSSVQPTQNQDNDDSETEGVVIDGEKRRRNTAASGKWRLDMLDWRTPSRTSL